MPHLWCGRHGIHGRLHRDWHHLDCFQFEAWLHADVPRVGCTACGKTTHEPVNWAHEDSGFTLLFKALAITMCQGLPVLQAAKMLRDHIAVMHDLDEKRLLFATPDMDHKTVEAFAQDLEAHGGKRTANAHACMDMSAAFLKGATLYLPNALVSYDRFHIVALTIDAMDEVRSAEWKTKSVRVLDELVELRPKEHRSVLWGMRRNPGSWSAVQLNAMHWLQRANLKGARAWRLKMALRKVFAKARSHNQCALAAADLRDWISRARRNRLDSFKRLTPTLKTHFDAAVRGMLDNRSNAFVEAMNGLLQQAKRAARGLRTATNFINIVYLRLSKLAHLPASPFAPATPCSTGRTFHIA